MEDEGRTPLFIFNLYRMELCNLYREACYAQSLANLIILHHPTPFVLTSRCV